MENQCAEWKDGLPCNLAAVANDSLRWLVWFQERWLEMRLAADHPDRDKLNAAIRCLEEQLQPENSTAI